jgi:hypothetical protein
MIKLCQLDFTNTNLYIGIDAHKKNWEIAIRCDSLQLKRFNMDPTPSQLAEYFNRKYPNAHYKAVFEAGSKRISNQNDF